MKSLALVLVALVAISAASQVSEDAKKELELKRIDAENRVRVALADALGNAIVLPLRQLDQIEPAGKQDLDDIAANGDSEEVNAQVLLSLDFWREKIEEAVAPFINEPEKWTHFIIDEIFEPEDPTWNNTEEYKKVLRVIEYMVDVTLTILNEEYQDYVIQISPQRLDEFTTSNFFKMLLSIIYEDARRSIINSGQRAKYNVANGAELINELFIFSNEAYMTRKYFNGSARILVEQYMKNVSS